MHDLAALQSDPWPLAVGVHADYLHRCADCCPELDGALSEDLPQRVELVCSIIVCRMEEAHACGKGRGGG